MAVCRSLILWDIDPTLVDSAGLGRRMYMKAFEAMTGRPLQHMPDMTGRTDRAIMRTALELHGIAQPVEDLADYFAALTSAAVELRDELRREGAALPGALSALAALAGANSIQTVVTGNLPGVAAVKLRAFGLAGLLDLDIGGYGSDADTRPPLIRAALERASRKYDRMFTPHDAVVIGDTPLDVAGAHEVGVFAVAVATGGSSAEELAAAGADVVIADLTRIAPLIPSIIAI
ncbi:MAG: haloacid dehalogenase-like hydrolase [Mycobacterium sp.]|nr:haloacid dehalogenase-like hydrolase [Mycobacterium sp.]